MQIREKGKKVLLIRTEYNSEKKRTYGKTIASQNRYLSTVSDEVCRLLTKKEVEQLKKWLTEREEKRSVKSVKFQFEKAKYSLSDITEALESFHVDIDDFETFDAELKESISLLKQTLTKRRKFEKRKKSIKSED